MIRFLAPSYLFALGLIAIPILIHLFNLRRYKKVAFTNVRFLQELKEETTRMNRVKHLVVLACRILAITCLVLAFAQPVIPSGTASPTTVKQRVSIFVDNSFSMEGLGKEGNMLNAATRKAREIAMAYPPSTEFQLLTNDFASVDQRLISREAFLEELEQVKISPMSRRLSEVVKRQSEALGSDPDMGHEHFVISDFQESAVDFSEIAIDSTSRLNLVALPLQPAANVFIDSCWIESPVVQLNRPVTLVARIRNSGEEDLESVPVKLLVNGSQRAVASVPVAAGASALCSMNFTITQSGWQEVEVAITDHPITFDDRYFLSFEVRNQLRVMSIDGHPNSPYLKALFGKDPFFAYTGVSASQVDYNAMQQQDMVLLNQVPVLSSGMIEELSKYLEKGGSLVLFPDSTAELNTYNSLLKETLYTGLNGNPDRVVKTDLKSPLFADVFEQSKMKDGLIDFPNAQKHFVLSSSVKSSIPVMQYQGGDAFLALSTVGRGSLYAFSVPLDPGFSNLARHAVIVPLLYRMALLSIRQPAFSYVLGRELPVEVVGQIEGGEQTLHFVNQKLAVDFIPSHRNLPGALQVFTGGQITQAGCYQLLNDKQLLANLAYNYDRKESALQFYSEEKLKELSAEARLNNVNTFQASTPSLTKTLGRLNEGIALWKWAIVLTLLFLLAEILLLRYWKTT